MATTGRESAARDIRAGAYGLPRGSGPAIGFAAAVVVSLIVVAAGGTRHHTAALAAYAAATVAVAAWLPILEGLAAALTTWPFLNGFVVHRAGELHWDGRSDLIRVAVLVAAAVAARAAAVAIRAAARTFAPRRRRARVGPLVPRPRKTDARLARSV